MRDLGFRTLDLRSGGRAEDQATWGGLCSRAAGLEGEADATARAVIAEVRTGGDAAVCELTRRFEGRTISPAEFVIPPAARAAACTRVPAALREALTIAATKIEAFHQTQVRGDSGLELEDVSLVSRVAPLRRVAVYAPGGTAAYPSSVLMAGIPAKVAGVPEVILVTPRAPDVVLLAAELAGIDVVLQIGGAQAIAALALGTATVPRVDKIVGPGNAYVTAAKRQVFGLCAIDGIAGPSEIVVAADATADPSLVAADLIAQAEHDVLACAILITDAAALIPKVQAALAQQLADLPRREIASQALRDHGAAVLVEDRLAMIAAVNAYAPEHVELLVADAEAAAHEVTTAGAIFVGPFTPEAAGDYTAGPSHVLPTAGAARFASPLGVWDFVKYTSVLRLGREALAAQGPAIARLARAEGLEGHARAAELRLYKKT